MGALALDKIRNIGFVAHIDAGKTTVTERILYYTGRIHRLGDVDEGTATTDWMIQEKERGITITSAATFCRWRDAFINIIDTPGHVDFTAEVERALRVLDGLVVIFSAVEGVEPQSETVWRQADRYGVPKIAFINKMDRMGASHERVLEQIRERFHVRPLLLQLPVGTEAAFVGVVDLVHRRKLLWDVDETGERYRQEKATGPEVEEAYEALVNTLAEVDEGVLEEYMEKGEVSPQTLKKALRQVTLRGLMVPVLMGSALKNRGIQPLLDAIVDYLPSPLEVEVPLGVDPRTGDIVERRPDPAEPFSGLVFKVQRDKHAGRLLYTRIYSGTLRVGQKVLNTVTGTTGKVHRIFRMHAIKRETLREAGAGDIVALVGLKDAKTGDTLCDPEAPVLFEGMQFPEPVVSMVIEPRSSQDLDRLKQAIQDMLYEDPTFRFKEDPDTGELIISGMGELHLEILVDRIQREFGVPVRLGRPQVDYRETITETVEKEVAVEREVGGTVHRGRVRVRVSPLEGRGRVEFSVPEDLPPEFREVVLSTLQERVAYGPLLGYPLFNLKIEVLDLDTEGGTPLGTRLALIQALREALSAAHPILLEPVMYLEVQVPADYVGNVVADLGHRGGELLGIEVVSPGVQKVKGKAPLKNLFGYAVQLRSLTQGRGNVWMKLDTFAPLPEKEFKEMLSLR